MPIVQHDDIPFETGISYPVSKIRGRTIVSEASGANASELWEQFQEPGGIINPHYHDAEELIVLLQGMVQVTIADETTVVEAPATLLVATNVVHRIENIGEAETHTLAFFAKPNPKTVWMQPLADS